MPGLTPSSADTDILYFEQLRTPVIVLNTVKAAEELLSKRGANYSDRPRFVLFEVSVRAVCPIRPEADIYVQDGMGFDPDIPTMGSEVEGT
jgi:hypothetical protein